MRIGEITKDNYMDYIKLFGGKNSQALDKMWGKDEDSKFAKTQEEEIAMLVKMGYIEEGMYAKEGDTSQNRIVSVSDEIKNKLLATVKRQFLTNGNGMNEAHDGDEIGAIMKEYRKNISPSERLAVTYTLQNIVYNENVRMLEHLKSKDPSWDYGKKFDPHIFDDYVSGGINLTV